jgi:hypothetical protein
MCTITAGSYGMPLASRYNSAHAVPTAGHLRWRWLDGIGALLHPQLRRVFVEHVA